MGMGLFFSYFLSVVFLLHFLMHQNGTGMHCSRVLCWKKVGGDSSLQAFFINLLLVLKEGFCFIVVGLGPPKL
jgi:hypothetical protein